ncbi:MAG: copper resistance protein CopC [Ilumatobacteraceae bacterium]|nr:copper resistance protein CopC [Ilumatobacteraceae bacterium]
MVSAHAVLDNSVPTSGATLEETPLQIVLDFDESVESSLGYIKLFSSNGKRIQLPAVKADAADASIVRVVPPTLAQDSYVAVYRVISVDGHPVEGAITFRVGAGAVSNLASVIETALKDNETSSAVKVAMALMRLISYIAVAVVLAGIFFLLGSDTPRKTLNRAVVLAGSVLGLSTALLYLLHGMNASGGTWGQIANVSVVKDVFTTQVGQSLFARIVVSFLLVCAIARWGNFVAVFSFVILPFTYAFAGHAAVDSPAALTVALLALHVSAIGVWCGGLLLLLFIANIRTTSIVEWFSRRAAILIAVAVATGVVQALLLMDGIGNLTKTSYGKALIAKVCVVGVMLICAAIVRRRFYESGVSRLRAVLCAEVVVGLVVLSITAGMVAASPRPTVSNAPFSTALVQGDVIANITISPPRVGESEIHVIVSPPNGSLDPVLAIKARFSLASSSVPPIQAELNAVGPNHFVGKIQFVYPGQWKVDVIVSPDANSEVLYSTQLSIK